MRTGNAN
ncbi:Microcin C7 [Escherichia coli]|uniref:Microcin C7 n=1 Tax=Escherichia coli TaxID=562 RepID=MCCC7_ECOLX|nr:RecName: Full=Microcin C7; Short=MccC7; AltName: Full=Microcin C51; Short=McC; Short=MccC51; Short=Microcin C [Escherichia coli]AAY68494.1 MccA [Escherichia coli]CAA40808.1 mccA [Escherichia coli]CAD32227.1 MccA heptapeptide [Escherichia coli]